VNITLKKIMTHIHVIASIENLFLKKLRHDDGWLQIEKECSRFKRLDACTQTNDRFNMQKRHANQIFLEINCKKLTPVQKECLNSD
jgi:hypothetical protein